MAGDRVDLVILTGGHSQWYFVRDILTGRLSRIGDVGLDNIQDNPERIISISLPQETVALGLAYQGLSVQPQEPQKSTAAAEPLIFVDSVAPTCRTQGCMAHWRRNSDGACFADEAGTQPLSKMDMVYLSLGHNFEWEVQDGERVEVCVRCGETGRRERIAKPVQRAVVGSVEPTVTPESEFELSSIGNCYGIRKYIGNRTHVVIPEEIRGRKVVAIEKCAFGTSNNYGIGANMTIESVTIPLSVTTIGEGAFAGCVNLHTVIAHQNIAVIKYSAFYNCKNLVRMDFGMGDCPLGVFKFPPSLKSIGSQAFLYTRNLGFTYCNIPKEVWISKETKLKSLMGSYKAFLSKSCAVFYYDK